MSGKHVTWLVLFIIGLLFSFQPADAEAVNMNTIDSKLKIVRYNLLREPPPKGEEPGECRDGLFALLDVLDILAPQTACGKAACKQLTEANQLFKTNGLSDQKARVLINKAYTVANNGKKFQMPKIKTIQEAVDISQKLMKSARTGLQQGKNDKAFKQFLEIAMMVTTPIHHE